MVRKIIWSASSKADKEPILKYWIERNKSKKYSRKLNTIFKQQVTLIVQNPGIGHLTKIENVRAKIVDTYIIYTKQQLTLSKYMQS